MRLEGLGKLKKFSDLNGSRTRDHPACSIVPQPNTVQRVPALWDKYRTNLILKIMYPTTIHRLVGSTQPVIHWVLGIKRSEPDLPVPRLGISGTVTFRDVEHKDCLCYHKRCLIFRAEAVVINFDGQLYPLEITS
jgi:hypothetical protein